jgi:hypothetical protein
MKKLLAALYASGTPGLLLVLAAVGALVASIVTWVLG